MKKISLMVTLLISTSALAMEQEGSHTQDEASIHVHTQENTEQKQAGVEIFFTEPEGVVTLFDVERSPENSEILTEEQKEIKLKASTERLIVEKQRKKFSFENNDVFSTFITREDLPITYMTGLSIDGGGMRGYISALLLQELSKRLSKPLHHYFDYIGGTSIGGILALGLTTPKSELEMEPLLAVTDLVNLFTERGMEIFPSEKKEEVAFYNPIRIWYGLKYLMEKAKATVTSRYSSYGLENLLKEKLGDRNFHRTLTNTLVTAVDIQHSRPQTYLFDSRDAFKLYEKEGAKIPLWKVGRSTSAAPTYFDSYKFNIEADGRFLSGHNLIDGGLWLNNPSTLVARSLLKLASEEFMFASHKNIVMLSLGTGYNMESESIPDNAGILTAASPVIDTLMNVSSFGSHEALKEILGKSNYLRINPELKENILLDENRPEKLEMLKTAAENKYDDIHNFIDGPFRKVLEADQFLQRQYQ